MKGEFGSRRMQQMGQEERVDLGRKLILSEDGKMRMYRVLAIVKHFFPSQWPRKI